jgi:hypothetical protein
VVQSALSVEMMCYQDSALGHAACVAQMCEGVLLYLQLGLQHSILATTCHCMPGLSVSCVFALYTESFFMVVLAGSVLLDEAKLLLCLLAGLCLMAIESTHNLHHRT